MAAETLCLSFITPSTSVLSLKHKHQFAASPKRFVLHFGHPRLSCLVTRTLEPSSSSFSPLRKSGLYAAALFAEGINGEESAEQQNDDVFGEEEEEREKKLGRPCEVYVCNLPRSCDSAQLLDMFKPHGTILSVEICRNAETGESRGCGYVKMGSINSARNAAAALDGSDVGGRDMRVRFSVEMNPGRRNPEKMNSNPRKVIYYEAPHKLYVGNLARTVRLEELRNLFSRFGNVASARVMYDHKLGKNRVFAFLSFQSKAQRDAAISLHGTEFCGRTLIVREGVERTEP
ncbi:31 kDa ribonucleoprotein, chloroplastic-like [Gastrolobium bilobum]|uniref:31 kDa ribonucleoprotein, chloroplastic-like n=1 Tax=Gastrolobium bilobum TaxID=150636 RepID=UPI002AAF4BAB|nr:31 kDa ribonucleoprotein, chloroplastic-like [Gastrolobium bilobum]